MEAKKSFDKESDYFNPGPGTLTISFLGHGSLAMELDDFVVYVDAVSDYGIYTRYPKADLILVTHEHADHLDGGVIKTVSKPGTRLVLSPPARNKLGTGEVLRHGETLKIPVPSWKSEIEIKAVPAYISARGVRIFTPRAGGQRVSSWHGSLRSIWPATPRTSPDERSRSCGYRLSADEPAVHDVAGAGGVRRPTHQALDPLSLPLRKQRYRPLAETFGRRKRYGDSNT